MKTFNIFLFLSLILFVSAGYSQPHRDRDCIVQNDDNFENPPDFPDGPPPDFDGPHGMKGMHGKMSDEKIEMIMDRISKKHPEFHKKLVDLKDKYPRVFDMTLQKLRRFVKNDKKGPENKAGILAILSDEIDLDLLIEKYTAEKDPKQKELIKSDLIKKMSAIFDKKEQMKQNVIADIEKNLEKKKAEAAKRKDDKEKIIKEDIEKILKFRDKMEKDRDK
ncbi:MAG TPA: hypothetical protein PLK90_01835 [Clostridiales bacterium]|nr:hypothetical protein [Clostridiales bacterium]HQP69116.1 hypothetical protein [Clostridiales bacterium]